MSATARRVLPPISTLTAALVALGCTAAPGARLRTEDGMAALLRSEMRAGDQAEGRGRAPEDASMSFDAMLQRALERDHGLARLGVAVEARKTERGKAASARIPRVGLAGSADVPLGGDEEHDGGVFHGGLFVTYNLTDAIFAKDLVSVSDAELRRAREERVGRAKAVGYDLLDLLSALECHTGEEELGGAAVECARKGLKVARELYRSGPIGAGIDAGELRAWSQRLRAATSKLWRSQERRASVIRKLIRTLGLPRGSSIRVTDLADAVPTIESSGFALASVSDSLDAACSQRSDVKMVGIELFLAEMKIVAARRSRLPRFSASVGVGNIAVLTDEVENAPVVASASVTMPLFDAGDRRRRSRLAKLGLEAAGQNAGALVRKVRAEVEDATAGVKAAARELQQAETWLEDIRRDSALQKELAGARAAGPLDGDALRWAEIEADVARLRARLELKRALTRWRRSRGDAVARKRQE